MATDLWDMESSNRTLAGSVDELSDTVEELKGAVEELTSSMDQLGKLIEKLPEQLAAVMAAGKEDDE